MTTHIAMAIWWLRLRRLHCRGQLHLGSVRTALFNNLVALASSEGAFILRVEDTDQRRLNKDAEKQMIQDLRWLGLVWTEGPDVGGPHGPYRQSERLGIYKKHVDELIANGHAYRCFCSSEDLERQKREAHETGMATVYPGTCRSLTPRESDQRAAAQEPHVVRFKGDAFGILGFKDAVYGSFQKKEKEEDFVIFKTDGYPTYHLANVVDDHLMSITHVIRGEEWLISTPKHLALYKAFGWKPPTFAHLGLLINDDGSKLSKRNASASITSYKDNFFAPMAFQTWLASLGSSRKSQGGPIPRTIAALASDLSYKFTKGGIKINQERLINFDSSYFYSILPNPTPEEQQIFLQNIQIPILKAVQSLDSNSLPSFAERAGRAWDGPKERTHFLAQDDAKVISHLLRTLHSRLKNRGDAQRLVLDHPHYFWRPPVALLTESLAAHPVPEALLSAIEKVCQQPEFWVDPLTPKAATPSSTVSKAVAEIMDGDGAKFTAYKEQRTLATGNPDRASHSSEELFQALGRHEWLHRVKSVRDTMGGM
ncbi:glutamyl-tRNA synthetase [Emericellopsis cladophorae]|uniref:Glutamyl-tRNA synthetase n=1 Tax=Emericellopsis cladophorae TaxID=2686198 RepID=A0A9Q0BH68_9HYPO|nr:glutamyl-tRNA synthetase [Emericellopsis cladophorae]KAI6784746.1 glutamyl-tRNA synthetase [Emericellopsis cladophorae]